MEHNWKYFAKVPNHLWELSHISKCKYFHIEKYEWADATTVLHTHDFIQIYYVHKGHMEHTVLDVHGSSYSHAMLTAGDLFILPPWFYHKVTKLSEDILYTSLCFSPELIHYDFRRQFYFCNFINHLLTMDIVSESVCPKSCISFQTEQGEVSTLLHTMLDEYTQQKAGYLTYIKGDLLKLLVIIARQYCESQPSATGSDTLGFYYEAVCNSIDYVNENFRQNLKLDEVAKQFLVSRTYFCKLFKQISGYTFSEYLTNLRLNHAKNLMLTSRLSATEVAHHSGFNDISNYCRQFKRAFGMSPTDYRKSRGAQPNPPSPTQRVQQ